MAVRNNNFDESKIIKKSKPINSQETQQNQLNVTPISLNKNTSDVVETKTMEKKFPVFKYEKDPNTLNVEIKNKANVKTYDFNISNSDLNIVKYNNNRDIIELEIDIYVLNILINDNDNNKDFYHELLLIKQNDLKFLKLKQQILDEISIK